MEESEEFFEISAVSRLTGISAHVLRVWERRYGVVEPKRSDSKRRMYSTSDLRRLALLKTLVENGHAISSVANLTTEQLQERISSVLGANCADDGDSKTSQNGDRVAIIGTKVRQAVREMVESTENAKLVGEYKNLADFESTLRVGAADTVVYEKDSVFEEDVEEVGDAVARTKVRRVLFVYHFAGEDVLKKLEKDGCIALRAPVDAATIRKACEFSTPATNGSSNGRVAPPLVVEGDVPVRLFSDEQLAKIAGLDSAIDCECPHHLGHLISGLSAFEQYSEGCENRNEQDAELHAFLHRATAQCRSQMEAALARVLEEEQIDL